MLTQVQAEFEEQQQAHEQVVGQSTNMLAQFNDLQARSACLYFPMFTLQNSVLHHSRFQGVYNSQNMVACILSNARLLFFWSCLSTCLQ